MKLFKPIMVLSILLLGSISNLPWVNPVTPLYSSLPGGAIWGTWTMANSPYYIEGNITVPFGKILSIEAGVDVVMNGSYHIFIGGQLFANGTLFSKINFKTNGTSDGMGSWKGLKFNSTGSGKLENCSIVNATHGILLNNTKDVIINNSYFYDNYYGMRIENNSYNNLFSICNFDANIYGMYFDNSPVNKILNGCTFRYGSYGLSFNNGSNNNIIGNCYSSFNNFGLYINSSSYNRIILGNILSNYEYGLLFDNSTHNTINGTSIRWNQEGIHFKGKSENNNIFDAKITENSFYGILILNDSRNISIIGSEIYDNQISIFNISNSNLMINDCDITSQVSIRSSEDVAIINSTMYSWLSRNVIDVRISSNIEISNCDLLNIQTSTSVIDIAGSNNILIDHCNISSYYDNGIRIEYTDDFQISNCTIGACADGITVSYSSSSGTNKNLISDCYISDTEDGIYLEDSNNTIIQNTKIFDISDISDVGIGLYSSANIQVLNTEIDGVNRYGIQTYICDHILIKNCEILNTSYYGLYLDGFSDYIQVINTKIYNNFVYGCKQSGQSSHILFYNCTFDENAKGFYISSIDNLEIRECKFLSNTNSGIILSGGKLSIYNSIFTDHYYTGIEVGGEELYIENSSFTNNYSPIILTSGSTAYLINTTFENQIILNQDSRYYVGWYLTVSVRSPAPAATPVANATVRLVPNYNDYQNATEFKTDATGKVRDKICYEEKRTYLGGITTYNPYRIEAHKAEMGSAVESLSITQSDQIMITLENNDLILKSLKFSWSNKKVPVNESFNITANIENTADNSISYLDILTHITGPGFDNEYHDYIYYIPPESTIDWSFLHDGISQAGDYTVTISVDHNDNVFELNEENNVKSMAFTVASRPVAILESNRTSIYEGGSIMFYANKSHGSPVSKAILEYIFNFSDDTDPVSLKTTFTVEHIFIKSGYYEVFLQVIDVNNIESEFDTLIIDVLEREEPPKPPPPEDLPVANFTFSPETGDLETKFEFNPSNSKPSTNAIIESYKWDFGDNETSNFAGPAHYYKDDGEYTVSLIVRDSKSRVSRVFNRTLVVRNTAPIAKLSADKVEVLVGEQVSFYANGSFDLDDTLYEPSARFIWHFGNKNNTQYVENSINAPDGTFDMMTRFRFTEPGVFNVTLTVYDDDGAQDKTIITIEVLLNIQEVNGGAAKKNDDLLLYGSIFIILIIIIVIISFFIFLRRRKKRQAVTTAKLDDSRVQQSYSGYGDYGDYTGYEDFGASYSEGSTKPKASVDPDKAKDKKTSKTKKVMSKATGKKARTSSIKPLEVVVNIPEEKVVFWKDEASAQNHRLSLDDVEVVSDEELLDASMIGIDHEEEDEEFVEYFELDEESELEWNPEEDSIDWELIAEDEPEDMDEVSDIEELEEEVGEEVIEEDFISPDLPDEEFEAIIEDEPEESPEEKLVFEFEEDGETKSKELEVTPTVTTTKPKPKPKKKHKKKDDLIAMPGIGFVKRSELQELLGMTPDEFDDFDPDDFNYEDIPIPDGLPLKIDNSMVSEPENRCKWCDKPIKGKYIKFRRKDEDGTKMGIIGPFCSPECADRFGR